MNRHPGHKLTARANSEVQGSHSIELPLLGVSMPRGRSSRGSKILHSLTQQIKCPGGRSSTRLGKRIDYASEHGGATGSVLVRIKVQQDERLLEKDRMLRERLVHEVIKENDGGSIRLVLRAPERQW
jgi:hypothetical protein